MAHLARSSVGELQNHIIDTLIPVAKHYNLSVDAFGTPIGDSHASAGQVTLSDAFGSALEPAPVTPSAGSAPYDVLSGTIRNVLTTSPRKLYENKAVIVAPSILLGMHHAVFAVRAGLISSLRDNREYGCVNAAEAGIKCSRANYCHRY